MASSGSSFEGPNACPFVALEFDRDGRSDSPDYRHRCFAEPTPAPRSIAHQEAYCLSPKFATCPVFQDWALRAAARPVDPADAADVADTGGEVAATADATPVAPGGIAFEPAPEPPAPASFEPPAPPDSMAEDNPFGSLAPADDEPAQEQLGAFDAQPEEPPSPYSRPDARYAAPPEADELPPESPAFVPPPDRGAAASAAVPPFLAGRTPRPQSTELPPPRPSQRVKREEIVPSWEIDGRYGAEAGEEESGDRIGGLLTALAVIIILALGVAGVVFLPGLLAGSPSKTPPPSFVVPSVGPSTVPSAGSSLQPTLVPTIQPTVAPATDSPSPEASPHLYRIKSGDSLAKVARKFKVDVADILAANPQIQNPDHIEVGQLIVIPAGPASPAPTT